MCYLDSARDVRYRGRQFLGSSMNKQALTDFAIRNIPSPNAGQCEIWDTRIPGFGVRVSHGGSKAFVLLYRFNGRPRRMTLGRYPTLSLADARVMAHEASRAAALGSDPGMEKIKARQIPAVNDFDRFVDFYIETYARPKNRSVDETLRLLRREFVSAWGSRPIGEIERHDITIILDRLMRAGKLTTANRALAAIRKIFNWAVERGVLAQSPCAAIRSPARPQTRDRVLADEELASIWKVAPAIGYPYGAVVQLLALTGQRRGEIVGMRWPEIDLDKALWSIPAERTKSARAHVVPLSPQAVRILTSLPMISTTFVFPALGRELPISGFSKWKRDLDTRVAISDWRIHDLRRTAASGMARLGVAPHVVERILNHTSGTLGGVAGIYNRFGYLPEMRAALELWSRHVAALQ